MKTHGKALHPCIPFVVVALLALGAFLPSLSYDLVWDDKPLIIHIDRVVEGKGLRAIFTSRFITDFENPDVGPYYRPVSLLSLWLDSRYAYFFPSIYHGTNIVLHALNSLLVLWLFNMVAGRSAAFIGAAMFALHPIHTESVVFVSGRTDLLAALFVFLSVILWLRVRRDMAQNPGKERVLSHLCFALACLSKEVAYLLPILLVAWDVIENGMTDAGGEGWWRRNRDWIAGWVVTGVIVFLGRVVTLGADLGFSGVAGSSALTVPERIGVFFRVLAVHVRLLLFPWPPRITYTNLVNTPDIATLAAAVLAVLAVFAVSRLPGTRVRQILISAAWFGVFFLPVSGIIPDVGHVVAGRFLYLPSLGAIWLGCLVVEPLMERPAGRIGMAILCAMLGVLMIFTVQRHSLIWKNDVSLFTEAVREEANSSNAHFNLGWAFEGKGMLREALDEYIEAVRINPEHARAWMNIADLRSSAEDHDAAIEALLKALQTGWMPRRTHLFLAREFYLKGEFGKALESYREVLRLAPGHPRARLGIALVLLRTDRAEEAETVLGRLGEDEEVLFGLLESLAQESSAGKIRELEKMIILDRPAPVTDQEPE